MKLTKHTISLLAALIVLAAACTGANAFSFADITYWVGSGSNQAALVIDWNDGIQPVSLAWGYRWDGSATGYDMFKAIVDADPYLSVNYDNRGGLVVFGIGYDVDRDGYAYVPGDDETGHAADADDHYKEGWMTAGYWSYNIIDNREDFCNTSTDWGWSAEGFRIRPLVNNSWDWWAFGAAEAGWDCGAPDSPVAAQAPVPEPTSLAAICSLIGLASSARLLRLRRK